MKKARILIVDDERNILFTLAKAMENDDYDIVTATTGRDALLSVEKGQFDVIILDLRLPDIDGMEVLKRLEISRESTDVIMITAHGSIDIAVEAMKNGCVDFIQKPFDVSDLRKAINEILNRKNISFQQALEFESLLGLAKVETKSRKYTKAISLVEKALELRSDDADAYNFLGVLNELLGKYQKAIAAYNIAISIDNTNTSALSNLERVRNLTIGTGMVFK